MLRTQWFHRVQRWLRDPRGPSGRITKQSEADRPPHRVHLSLEELEPRVVLSTTDATPPPSFQQAAIRLYIDGLELGFDQFSPLALQILQSSIAFYTPYAQPFSQLLVLAGASAGVEALNHFTSISGAED
jgi:hypothetical protein